MKIYLTLVVFVAIAAHADARKKCFPVPTPVVDPPPNPTCPQNEIYSECGANGCQSTCKNPTLNQVCKAQCIAGCICQEGYLRDSNGKCVLVKDCLQIPVDPPVPVCPKNKVYSECGANSCQMFCDWALNLTSFACRPICTAGCICEEGLVLDKEGNCIPVKQCPGYVEPKIEDPPLPPACSKKHESFTDCGTACPLTCDNVNNPPIMCAAVCLSGCFCDKGYVRNADGDCVLKEECPVVVVDPPPPAPKCKKEHESYTTCGSACPLTCDKPTPGICTKQCVSGCFCDAGYVRDKKGNCVLVEDCPKPECGKHETYSDCGASPCQATCANPSLPMMCKAACKPGCGCDEGYVREDDGTCVLLKKCKPTLQCEDNEEYDPCTTLCGEPTCDRSNALYCGAGGCQPKCLCKKGYVRNAEDKCIKSKDCPAVKPGKGGAADNLK